MDRITTLQSFIAKKPEDPFPRYGLAMEYRNAGDHEQAQAVFDELMERFPGYVAAYLMAGNNLEDLGRRDVARAVYQRGIEACRSQGDAHTQSELQQALDALG